MAETERAGFGPSAFGRDLVLFLCAVLVGTTAGIGSQLLLLQVVGPQTAADVALAFATTCTGAAHGCLVHRKPIRDLLLSLVAGAPVAYATMRALHFVVGF